MPFARCREAVRTGKTTMNEVAVSNNQHLLVQWSTAVTDDGRTHVIETITDVTAQKRLEEASYKAEKMEALGRLAGGTAHEINNLLTVITGASELVSDEREAHGSTYDPVRQLQHAVGRVAELMRRLIAFSHNQQIRPVTLDLNAVLSELEPRIRTLCGQAVDVTVAVKGVSMPVVGDPQQIEQIIMTLVDNACQAMPSDGHLMLSAATESIGHDQAKERNLKPGMFARLDVRDTGPGIDSATQAHLFEPYFSQTGLQAGRGLGLASVYGMVRQCGGGIEVESERGVGSLFRLWFPCIRTRAALVRDRPTVGIRCATILLVEDDDDVRLAVSDMLKRAGYQVQEACDGLDALRKVQSLPSSPHLTLTDVMMPRMTGPQFARQIHAVMPTTKILYMSGYTDHVLEPIGTQPLAFIQKPFTRSELIHKIRETLNG